MDVREERVVAFEPGASEVGVRSKSKSKLILASGSPRRVELLRSLNLTFEVIPSQIDENTDETRPQLVVEELSIRKAKAVAELIRERSVTEEKIFVIGADTIVVLGDQILGKPANRQEAIAMLSSLSGQCHFVYTGLALIDIAGGITCSDYRVSRVFFRVLHPKEIEAYADSSEPYDKAGSYALQGLGSSFIEKIEGCYTNVIGLSVPAMVSMLRKSGIAVLGLDCTPDPGTLECRA